MKQMDRRLLILMRLREERPIRAADRAEVCECSVRTIYRDIDALCEAGVQPDGALLNLKPEELLFEYDIQEAMMAYWENVGQPDTRPVRIRWRERDS